MQTVIQNPRRIFNVRDAENQSFFWIERVHVELKIHARKFLFRVGSIDQWRQKPLFAVICEQSGAHCLRQFARDRQNRQSGFKQIQFFRLNCIIGQKPWVARLGIFRFEFL